MTIQFPSARHALILALSLTACGCHASGKYRFAAGERTDGNEVRNTNVSASALNDPQTAKVESAALLNPVAFEEGDAEAIPKPLPADDKPQTDKLSKGEPSADKEPVDQPSVGEAFPGELNVDWLVAEVLARNPDVQSAAAAWRAAALRNPQQIALDDPMFGTMLGPGAWGNPNVNGAYMVEASQKIPWPGKRSLRGDVAQAEAKAAYFDVGEQRLRIAELARTAFYDDYLAHRQLAVLEKSAKLLASFRDIATTKYESAKVEQQDVLLADVELAQLERRRLELDRQARVAEARLNTLLLLPADAPLAHPPAELPLADDPASADELRTQALSSRPELAAQQARIRAQRYSIALACKDYYPDVEVVGRYDAFWQESPLRPMVGMNLNVPLYKAKRRAAVGEARARLAIEQANLDSQINEIAFAAEQARQEVIESRQSLAVYQDQLLPTAEKSIESARASYMAGKLDFLRLIESQRQLLALQDEYYTAVAEYHQRLAALDRVIGSPPPLLNERS